MEHALIPQEKKGEICFVLRQTPYRKIRMGPSMVNLVDRADAIAMIKRARNGSTVVHSILFREKNI